MLTAALSERDQEIWELRVSGHSLRAIGEKVGLSHVGVAKALQRAYEACVYPKVEEARKVDLERIEKVIVALETRVDAGDDKAIQNYFRALDRKAKMLGLDAPIKHDVQTTETTQQDLEIQDLISEFRARNDRNAVHHNAPFVVTPTPTEQ